MAGHSVQPNMLTVSTSNATMAASSPHLYILNILHILHYYSLFMIIYVVFLIFTNYCILFAMLWYFKIIYFKKKIANTEI